MYVCMYVCMHARMYVHTHTHTHTHTHQDTTTRHPFLNHDLFLLLLPLSRLFLLRVSQQPPQHVLGDSQILCGDVSGFMV